ncbi:cytochrome o ubiquinol oxidase subunit IV [Candidatus Kaiserbacteria bacterium]|nr:cytochrome o ubiquinol oxidase subunit IV [Candidatus Kaiserbacteria bacterium]
MQNDTQIKNTGHGSLALYVTGFAISIVLTLIAYFLVVQYTSSGGAVLSQSTLIFAIVALAIMQLIVQLVFFLHLGRDSKPHWNTIVFAYAALLIVAIVVGSLWVMYHLNYNMMLMPPAEVDAYMLDK